MRAIINGKEYELEFAGYDRATYKHTEGCLVHPGNAESRYGAPCQCGAAERADRWYQVKLPAPAPETLADRQREPDAIEKAALYGNLRKLYRRDVPDETLDRSKPETPVPHPPFGECSAVINDGADICTNTAEPGTHRCQQHSLNRGVT